MKFISFLFFMFAGLCQATEDLSNDESTNEDSVAGATASQALSDSTPEAPVISLPGSEILLFDITGSQQGDLKLSVGINISNSPGYDSQPRFSGDGKMIYYTHAVMNDSSFQMDIYQYDIENDQSMPYLTTALSEYSPTPMPHKDGLSVVQVDKQSDQYVVFLNKELKDNKKIQRYSDLKQVGYFNWTKGGHLWSFILNDDNGGDLYHQGMDLVANKVSDHVGRSFITDQAHNDIFYVDKNTIPWKIMSRSSNDFQAKDIMALPLGVEDFTLDSKNRFWAGRDNTLYVSTDQKRWYIVKEFIDPKYNQISRLTTNPDGDQIAIVFAEKSNNE